MDNFISSIPQYFWKILSIMMIFWMIINTLRLPIQIRSIKIKKEYIRVLKESNSLQKKINDHDTFSIIDTIGE